MKRLILITLLALSGYANIIAQSITDGRAFCFDQLTNTYLYSVPEERFDDGSVQDFTASHPDINFTFLPILKLEGDFGYEYTEGKVTLIMPDGTINNEMRARVKWRGGTTNTPNKHKRNYSIKFIGDDGKKQDRKFFGLRSDNHWILDAGQADLSRIRNRVATDIWNDFATKPYYIGQEPKAKTGTRGQFVEVFLGDEYRGIYCMTENIDRSQMKLKKYTDNGDGTQTIHGQLWKCGNFTFTGFWSYGDYDNTSETWGGFETKYPDIDDINPTDYSLIYDAVRFASESSAEDFTAHVAEYFDIPVLSDYIIFCNLLVAIDNWGGKNMFWACYDRDIDKKLTLAVWDMDATTGSAPSPGVMDRLELSDPCVDFSHNINIVNRLDTLNVDNFREKMLERYKEVRQTYFTEEAFTKRYSDYMDMLAKAGAYDREAARWSGDTDIAGATIDYESERAYIIDWISKRLPSCDYEMEKHFTATGINSVTSSNSKDDITYNLLGQRISTSAAYGKKQIVIKNGRKYLK